MNFLKIRNHSRVIFISVLLATGLISAVLAQGVNPGAQPANQPADNTTVATGNADGKPLAIENYNPTANFDPRFQISNIQYDVRLDPNGQGEFLDITLVLQNGTQTDIDLYAVILAYYETNAVDKETRKLIPYPVWRVNDPDKYKYVIHNIAITPTDIEKEKIWNENDVDYQRYMKTVNRMRNSVGASVVIPDPKPPAWKYFNYIMKNTKVGLKFKLHGIKAPKYGEHIMTNYIPVTEEQKRNYDYLSIHKHKYTVEYFQKRTIFRSHHLALYGPDFHNYNHFAIFLFNGNDVEQATEGQDVAPVYFRAYTVDRKLKVR